ncbi:MAG: patatin-like phospholipase family protein [Bacteroidales bacterium]|nr:patatin-like phospholipase family protein [Bacteroidales bacterium]
MPNLHHKVPSFYLALTLCLVSFTCLVVPNQVMSQSRPKVGVVLSGGGAAGLAHIGVIKVLEEIGIPVDFVAGTSMGSIVGGMYAMGYTAAEMEKMVKEMDWEMMLTDVIPRNDLTWEYKEQLEKFFYDFPLNQGKLQLPSGLIAGTNITNMLAGITWPAYNVKIFNQLPRPFVCIGADVVTGEEVVLSSGNLHDALRASMAIPTVFTPVELNGKLLVDGGLINNFPADHLKAMGADLIIGIDVQRDLFKITQLNSVITILKQISTLTREDINIRNRQLCDILIRPSTPGASTLTFGLADSIIRSGERCARAQWIQLKKIADQVNKYASPDDPKIVPLPKIDSVYVREIAFTGLHKVDPDYVQSRMNLHFPGWMHEKEIFKALQRVFGTNEFSKVTYQMEPVSGGVRLTVRAEEKEQNLIHVGLHFDNLFNASLMAKADLRNLLRKGDQLGVDVNLGENPNLLASYFFLFNKKRQFGLLMETGRLKSYEYLNNRKISSANYVYESIDLVMRTNWREKFSATAGIQSEFAWILPNIGDWQIQSFNAKMINLYLQLKKDNFNKIPYPTRGDKLELMIKEVNNLTESSTLATMVFDFRYRWAIELSPKLSL